MNRYRRYPQTHAVTTAHLSLMEEGAYSRLLDWQYSNESPLPSSPEERYRITRALTAAERRATEKIAAAYFDAEGWQPRAREEIEGDGSGRSVQAGPDPSRQAAPPLAAGANPAPPLPAAPQEPARAQQPEPRPSPPAAIPKAIVDLGHKLLGAAHVPAEEIAEFLRVLCGTAGNNQGFELLRACERAAVADPVAWLDRAVDAHMADRRRGRL